MTFICSPPNDKYSPSYSRTQHSRKRKLHTWFLCFVWCPFFAFWGADNHVFHILPIPSRSYVLKSFGCLEASNRVSNWKKRKNLFYVWSLLQICQLELPVIITLLMSIIYIFTLFLLKFRERFDIYVLTPIDKYKIHSRGTNTNEKISYVLDFLFRLMFILNFD